MKASESKKLIQALDKAEKSPTIFEAYLVLRKTVLEITSGMPNGSAGGFLKPHTPSRWESK